MNGLRWMAAGVLIGAMILAPCVLAQQVPPAEVQQAAEQGLGPLLSQVPAPAAEDYGFAPGDAATPVTLGAPFRVHTVSPAALAAFQNGQAVDALLAPTSQWYYPVLAGDQVRAMLVVDRLEGRWQAVSLGYAKLAAELGAVTRQWKAAQGFHPVLAICYQARQHLFTVPEKGVRNLTRIVVPTPTPDGSAAAAAATYAVLTSTDDAVRDLKADLGKTLP